VGEHRNAEKSILQQVRVLNSLAHEEEDLELSIIFPEY
jgi:hypothetical protein